MGVVDDQVIGPDMVGSLGPQTDTGAVIAPEPLPFRLYAEHFKPLPAPDPLDPLVVHQPA